MPNTFEIMGVLNVTPDSFSDGGKNFRYESAIVSAIQMRNDGASIIDIGGESTRPGADEVALEEEVQRVIPIIQALKSHDSELKISIDTSKPDVMKSAIKAGVDMINDVNALQVKNAVQIVAESGLPVCLMHKQGDPKTMQNKPQYTNVVEDVTSFLSARVDECLANGILEQNIILDPGIGFGKTLEHNLQLLKNIPRLKKLGFPVLIGASRKAMIGQILNQNDPMKRIHGSLAVAQYAFMQGAKYLRVHDVKPTHDVLKITQELTQNG